VEVGAEGHAKAQARFSDRAEAEHAKYQEQWSALIAKATR
jgi:hypothetical protein